MNISVIEETIKGNRATFSEIEKEVFKFAMLYGQELLRLVLNVVDKQLAAERDVKKYRDKGYRKTVIKTLLGEIEFSRKVYRDTSSEEPHYVYLLDEALGMRKIGLVSGEVCKFIASTVTESSFRKTADQLQAAFGISISPQAVWNIVQALGERQEELAERYAERAIEHQGLGEVETPILYEENDGIWLSLQGKDRKKHGPSKEMKVGIAYDGVELQTNKYGRVLRRKLSGKVAFATFNSIKDFRRKKEGIIANHYDTESIDLRVVNGDGAAWIQKTTAEDTISVLDAFHRNKKIRECIPNKEHAQIVREMLLKGDYDELLEFLEICIDSVATEEEKNGFRKLYKYYSINRNALGSYFERGIEIPPTRDPEKLHHARLGSMESNVFTLVGNRMKGRRRCWSISGGNHMVTLLCAYHTVGFEDLFAEMPEIPVIEPEWIDEGIPLAAAKIKESVGKGYAFPGNISTQSAPAFMRELSKALSRSSIV